MIAQTPRIGSEKQSAPIAAKPHQKTPVISTEAQAGQRAERSGEPSRETAQWKTWGQTSNFSSGRSRCGAFTHAGSAPPAPERQSKRFLDCARNDSVWWTLRYLLLVLTLLSPTLSLAQQPPTSVTKLTLNTGTPQRSTLTSIALEFSADVATYLKKEHLVLRNLTTGQTLDPAVFDLTYNPATHLATWTFPTSPAKSLAEGNYLAALKADALLAPLANRTIDTPGLGLADSVFTFHRRFGDSDGDRDVDFLDTARFRKTWNKTPASPDYAREFDADLNGTVNVLDLNLFRQNYFTFFPPVAAIHASLFNDTGLSTSDGLTSDPTVTGIVFRPNPNTTFRAGLSLSTTPAPLPLDTTADLAADGTFLFTPARLAQIKGSPLDPGAYKLHLETVEAGAVSSFFDLLFTLTGTPPCEFADGNRWVTTISPPTSLVPNPVPGSVTFANCEATMTEGDSFQVTLEKTFPITAANSVFHFTVSQLSFDAANPNSIQDSFEAAIVDAQGRSLVYNIQDGAATPPVRSNAAPAPSHDAFFNATDTQATALAPGVTSVHSTLNTQHSTISLPLSHLPLNTSFRLIFRLINNDRDRQTTVRISDVALGDGGTLTPAPAPAPVQFLTGASIDFTTLSEVSASAVPVYGRTSFAQKGSHLFADFALRNAGSYPFDKPLIVALTDFSDPAVRVLNADGLTPDGLPWFDFSEVIAAARLAPGQTTGLRRLSFSNPARAQFTYRLVVLSQLNRTPFFTTTPPTEGVPSRAYSYPAKAADPDGDNLTYSLIQFPAGMTINAASGLISWTPVASQLGSNDIRLRATDGNGGVAEQHFTITVITPPPNRPPIFVSTPVTVARVSQQVGPSEAATIFLSAHDADLHADVGRNNSAGAQHIVRKAIEFVQDARRNAFTQAGIKKFLFVQMPSPIPADVAGLSGEDGLINAGFLAGIDFDHSDRTTLREDLIQLGTKYSAIFVGSYLGQEAEKAEFEILNDNSSTIIQFLNRGGGLVAMSQSPAYGNITPNGGFYGFLPFIVSSQALGQTENGNTLTAFGQSLGLSNTDINGNFSHNVFLDGSGFGIVDRDAQGRVLSIGGFGQVFSGGVVQTGEYAYDADALDSDGDPLTYSLVIGPANMTISAATGLVRWAPAADQIGNHDVTIKVSDGRGGTAIQAYTLTVLGDPTNHPPVITSTPPVSGVAEAPFTYQVTALDSDGDPRTFRLDSLPAGMVIGANSGLISWNQPRPGPNSVRVAVTDGRGGEDTQSFTLCISISSGIVVLGSGESQDTFSPLNTSDSNLLLNTARNRTFTSPFVPAIIGPVGTFTPLVNNHPISNSNPLNTSGFYRRMFYLPCELINTSIRIVANTDDNGAVLLNGNVLGGGYIFNQFGFGTVTVSDPTFFKPGENELLFVVNNNGGGPTGISYEAVVRLGTGNLPPTINSQAPLVATVSLPYEYVVRADDPNGDPLTFSLTTAPVGMQVGPIDGRINWTPLSGQMGLQDVAIKVTDSFGASASQTFALTVSSNGLNHPPQLLNRPGFAGEAGFLFSFNALATDPDGDPIRYFVTGSPAGMTIDALTGALRWVPTDSQTGGQSFTVILDDGRGGRSTFGFSTFINGRNHPPVITSQPTGPAVAGTPWQYQVTAQDADGDPIQFGRSEGPPALTVNADSGLASWTPAAGDVGLRHVVIKASDNHGASAEQFFDLPVVATAANDPPQITSTPRASVRLGDTYLYQVSAFDPNSDPLTFSIPTNPAGMTITAAGLVSWKPTAAQFGANPISVRLEDGRGGFATQGFTVNVVSNIDNRPPDITSTPRFAATVGKPYAYDAKATDPDGDVIVWSLDTKPAGMSIDATLGTLRWTPTLDQLGLQSVVVRVTDAQGAYATQSYTITVRATNLPPQITSIPPTIAAINTAYIYPVGASDPEGEALTYSLTTSPFGMAINPTTGLIQWTPAAGQLGPQNVVVSVQDPDHVAATQSYTIVVSLTAENRAPVITSIPGFAATVGIPYQYPVTASDADGEALTFSLVSGPAGMSFTQPSTLNSQLLQWTPTLAQVGVRSVVVKVTDPRGAAGTQSFTIAVAATNAPPNITSIPGNMVFVGQTYRYDVKASDPDGDPLTYRLTQAPASMTIDALGRLTWTPIASDAGTRQITVLVEDNKGLGRTQTFDLTAVADTTPPFVLLGHADDRLPCGAILDITARATDSSGIASLTLTFGGVPIPLDGNGNAEKVLDQVGVFEVLARAVDKAGNAGQDSYQLTVFERPVDGIPPAVAIASPIEGAMLTAPTTIIGTVQDNNLVRYTLKVIRADDDTVVQTIQGTQPVNNGPLGKLDTSILANDAYKLNLTAEDASGNSSSVEIAISIEGELKLGNFRLSFTDLSLPVNGIPITVARTYDTLTAGQGKDFGYGWRLEFRHADLRSSVPRATPEEREAGIFNAFKGGSRVYVTLPGGKREGFTFRPVRQGGFAGSIFGFHDPAFVPDAGVTSRLSVRKYTLQQLSDGSFISPNGLAYNPEDELNFGGSYTLSTKDGLGYEINAQTGDMRLIADGNGNTLTLTDSAIISSAGPRITFERDPQGRITAVVDPTGKKVRYSYDAKGDLVSVTDREGNMTRFVYASPRPHYLTEVIDPLNRTGVRTEYDAQGRLVRLVDAADKAVTLGYDPENSTETVEDALHNITTFKYDDRGNVVKETNALGGNTNRTYNLANYLTSETDPLGKTTNFTYDADGNVLTRTDPLGNVTRNGYVRLSPGGLAARLQNPRPTVLLATTTDPLGNTTSNTYDGNGNVLATTDAAGNITRYAYDAAGNQTSITDAAGKTTSFQYDGAGHLLKQTDAAGNETTFTYDANGNQLTQATKATTATGLRTLTTTTAYDANGRPISVTDPEGNITRTEYDKLGNTTATVDALGHRTEFIYDDRGKFTGTSFADGTLSMVEYDAVGRRTASIDRAGRRTGIIYDALGRLVKTIFPDDTPANPNDNPFTLTEYDLAGRVAAQIDERGNRTEFAYDDAGRQTLIKNALGHITRSAYDTAGRKVTDTDALGRSTRFVYDALGRRTETQFADGTTKKTAYDVLGRVVTETDQAGVRTKFEYDALGRLLAVVDALNQRTEYTYNEPGNLLTQKDAKNHVTRYAYDGLGRRVGTTLPLGQTSSTAFNAVGNLASATDFRGFTTAFEYDANNRLTKKTPPTQLSTLNPQPILFTYTPTGRRKTITDARGVTTFAYDARDRLLSRTDPDGRMIAYEYDKAGNRISLKTLNPQPSTLNTQLFSFDALNRLATVTDPDGGVTAFTYDEVNNVRVATLPNGTTRTDTYDALHRLTLREHRNAGGVFASYQFTLGPTGNRTQVVENTGRTVQYAYDNLYRLTQEKITNAAPDNRTIDYTMDAVGNRLTRADSIEGATTSTYDDNDQLLSETLGGVATTYTYDANGNTLTRGRDAGNRATYRWDFQNRLVVADVTDSAATKHLTYAYDDDGIRVASTVGEGPNTNTTSYLVDANRPFAQVVEEWTSLNSQPSTLNTSYTHGPHHLISQSRAGARTWYHADGLGSTRALTSQSGTPTDRYQFDAYGRTLTQTGPTENAYLYAGEQRDKKLGLDYLRARYLNFGAGRFHRRDSFEGEVNRPLSRNQFIYTQGNPVNSIDPSGNITLADVSAVLGILNTLPNISSPRVGSIGGKVQQLSIVVTTVIRPPQIEAGVKTRQSILVNNSGALTFVGHDTGVTNVGGLALEGFSTFRETAVAFAPNLVSVFLQGQADSAVFHYILPFLKIDYDFQLHLNFLTKSGTIRGTHDGFPSYEIRVKGDVKYDWQQQLIPILGVGSLPSLSGSEEITVPDIQFSW